MMDSEKDPVVPHLGLQPNGARKRRALGLLREERSCRSSRREQVRIFRYWRPPRVVSSPTMARYLHSSCTSLAGIANVSSVTSEPGPLESSPDIHRPGLEVNVGPPQGTRLPRS